MFLLLTLAFYLSVLTYYIGTLIYMLPIPFYGLKKWAPQLMVDGVFSAIVVFSYSALLWLIDNFSTIIGADWSGFHVWFIEQFLTISGFIVTLKTIGAGLSSIGLNFLANSLISPMISTLTYLLIFLSTFYILVLSILNLAPVLLAIGSVLHSVPFRLTRGGGATLMSVVLVFSTCSPLMPHFVNVFSNTTIHGRFKYGYLLAEVYVYDALGNPVPHYVYEIYSNEGELLARYSADSSGLVNASSIEKGIPSVEFKARVAMAGYFYETRVESLNPLTTDKLVHNCSNLFVPRPLRAIALFNYDSYTVYSYGSDYLSMSIGSTSSIEVVVVFLREDVVETYVDGVYRNPVETYEYTWRDVRFKAHRYQIPQGTHHIYISIQGSGTPQPSGVDEVYYARDTLGVSLSDISSLIQPVSTLIFRFFIAPVVFISILISTSLALSKLLGGSSGKIARIVVTGI